ncbi:uncharacterized protein Z518_05679 [Rhinocladiella mackenziei CBS 650.93]|uniref:FAD/NAD(P)-binding domain-containing protein n=1 Tax=Rhinocladiella mackenziei CBS 650.93 TaxID=1442369 RepID=A0A0D2H2Z9_9EURO|nr:uncharacterized protein Z518_05679 [Rhinocladiella mackenziei CBS 650.93]KIX04808.1 hypothetical protein Z518_05679 [Rhinocladiella mackenziei CBS 650.93]
MEDEKYCIEPQWHSKPRPIRIICIGAGAAGLLVAYKTKKLLKNIELIIYEKSPDIGGTWYENRYPGCACDVPAHVYTYSFEPNPSWSSFYTSAPEIKNGSGRLFQGCMIFGELFYTVPNWDSSVDWERKTVAVIGPGHEELKKRLIPLWPPGCRRITPGEGYLEALIQDNVTTIHDEIVKVVSEGLIDATGRLHEVDMIVCVTGFDVSFKPSFKVLGIDGYAGGIHT